MEELFISDHWRGFTLHFLEAYAVRIEVDQSWRVTTSTSFTTSVTAECGGLVRVYDKARGGWRITEKRV